MKYAVKLTHEFQAVDDLEARRKVVSIIQELSKLQLSAKVRLVCIKTVNNITEAKGIEIA